VVNSLPGSSKSGVGAERSELPVCFATVFCEVLIVSRSTPKCLASAVSASDSESVGPRHQDSSFLRGFMVAF
jgi:hypothetical protein